MARTCCKGDRMMGNIEGLNDFFNQIDNPLFQRLINNDRTKNFIINVLDIFKSIVSGLVIYSIFIIVGVVVGIILFIHLIISAFFKVFFRVDLSLKGTSPTHWIHNYLNRKKNGK